MVDGTVDGWASYEEAVASCPPEPLADESLGTLMLYSSGTTGRPKGIVRAQHSTNVRDYIDPFRRAQIRDYGFFDGMVYLSTAPLYHSAPMAWALQMAAVGGTFSGASSGAQ